MGILNKVKFGASNALRKFNVMVRNPAMRRVGDRFPVPRKVDASALMSQTMMPGIGTRLPDKKVQRQLVLAPSTLKRLAYTDAITWAIIRTRRDQVANAKWDIVPKLENFNNELDRWQDVLFDNLNPWGYVDDIELKHVPEEIYHQNISDIKAVFSDPTDKFDKKARIKWIFQRMIRHMKDRSQKHVNEIKRVISRPCNEIPTFEDLQELVLDDILIFDAGIMVMNNDRVGRLAEIYTIPGDEVFLYRNEDRTIPEPPEFAYLWEQAGTKVAEFTRDELVYIMANPGQNFYGRSPVETAAFTITQSLTADSYNNDFLKFSDVPPGILNLGKDVTDDQRTAFKAAWEREKQGKGGVWRVMFTSGSDDVEFIPLRQQSNKDMQMFEYLKWTLSIKCACFQISPQDIGFTMDLHRSTSEVQYQITRDKGLRSILNKLQKTYNTQIIKKKYPAYHDAEFKFLDMDATDELTKSNMAQGQFETGVITLNEAREDMNKKPVPGGDILLSQRIPGQGYIPVGLLEKESDKLEVTLEQEESMKQEEDMTGETEQDDGGQIPSEEKQAIEGQVKPQIKPQVKPVEVNPADVGKLQKVIDSLKDGDRTVIKFTDRYSSYTFDDGSQKARERLEGFKAGISQPEISEAANVFSPDENERVRGTYAILGIAAAPVIAGVGIAGRKVGWQASKFAGRELMRVGSGLVNTMPGKAVTNSKIVGGAINYYRRRMGKSPIKNVNKWLYRGARRLAGLATKGKIK